VGWLTGVRPYSCWASAGFCPRVVHIYVYVVFAQLADDVDHLGVAQVGAVFLEGKAHDEHFGAFYMNAALHQGFHQLAGHIGAHAVVQAAAGQMISG
jgi:hypothetical protein